MSCCPNVVVIEDDIHIRASLKEALEDEGYHVSCFGNGREAIEGLKGCQEPCLILLDLMMPVMDGWEFLKVRQALGDTIITIPVVVISAVPDVHRIREAGATDWMKKPLDIDALLKVVGTHCDPDEKAA